DAKVKLMSGIAQGDTIKIPTAQLIFMGVHVVQTVAYIFASYKFIDKKEEELKHFSSDVYVIKKIEWLNAFSLYFALYFLLYFIVVVLLTFINSYQFQLDYLILLI